MESTATPVTTPARSGHVEANGVNYYYQIHGEGEPLLLLHGGLGSIEMFGPVLPMLASGRQVIGVDLHGHGRTALGDREISAIDMGDDMAVLLAKLGYGHVDVLGYSLGAKVAFRLAVQHPERVRRLALVSGAFAQDGFYPEMLPMQAQMNASVAEFMKDTPMYQSYVAIAPHPEDFPKLLDRIGAAMRTSYDWAEDVKKLTMPVMLVYGDSDMFRPEHIVKFYQLLGGGLRDAGWMREHMSRNRLAILPDLTHYEIFCAPAMATTVLPFLNGESGAKSWAESAASSSLSHSPTKGLYGWITHTELASADPTATKEWCAKALGWTFMPSFPIPGGEYHLFAYSNQGGGGIRANNPPEVPGSIPYIHVEDAQAAYDKALHEGAEEMLSPMRVTEGVTVAIVRAPGGVPIGFSGP